MKRFLVLCLVLVFLFLGCDSAHWQTATGSAEQKKELSVAYMETDRASEQIIKSFSSETVKLIPLKISEADFDDFLLRREYGVDVILIPNSTQINMTAYALDGGVRNLIPFLPEITEGVDCYPVLDAGKIGIFRYYLPLRFELPQILTTEPETDIGSTLYDALRLSGVWSADPTQKDIPVSEDVLSEYARYVKAPQDTVSPELLGAPCPQYESDDAITADITLYAAIDHGAEKQDKYLEFLRHALTTPEGQGEGQGLSVCRTAAQKYLKTHRWRAKWIKAVCPDAEQGSKMPDAAKTAWEAALEKVSSGSIRNAYWARIFSAAMDAYTKGDATFEECLEALKERLYYAPDETGLSVFELTLPEALRQELDREKTYISYGHRYPSSNYPFDWCEFAEEKYISGEKSYYGTFHGGIVYRPTTSSILTRGTHYKLGSVEIEYGADFDMLVFKNGVFFDLAEAYELGFITEADAAVIAERLASFEAARMPQPIETQPTELPPSTEPSTEPVDENALTQEEIDEFKYMFTQHFNEDPSIPAAINYYNRILWSDFETPAQVNIRWVFYDQDIDENWELTEAEQTYLSQFEYVPLHLSVVRVSVEKMNRVLQQHLGISLEETERVGMETMAYYSDTDCYYSGKGDMGVGTLKIYRGRWLEEGKVEIEYNFAIWDKVMILQKTDSGYIVLSNKTV